MKFNNYRSNSIHWHGHTQVYDVAQAKQLHSGPLPLSPRSTLTWLSLTDTLSPVTMDSTGVLRLCTPSFGMSWMPVFESADHRKGSETFWPVGVQHHTFYFITCYSGQQPQVKPQPMIESMALPGPRLPGEEAVVELEAEILSIKARVAGLRHHEQSSTFGSHSAALAASEQLSTAQLQLDKASLRMFDMAVKQDRTDRALQVAFGFELPRTLENAVKLANHRKKSALAMRVQAILETRLAAEDEDATHEVLTSACFCRSALRLDLPRM